LRNQRYPFADLSFLNHRPDNLTNMATPESESPLITALPPQTDYISYLTIIEHYLSEDTLPILHKVLQDEKLTTNIGWDLVHLLVPLLPHSTQCLQDIARLGNPREVILKVTESLRLIDYEALDEQDEDEQDAVTGASSHKTAPTAEGKDKVGSSQAAEMPPPLPLPVNQFTALLSMLATLQNRIKTKYPSRFLSTTLQAILASFSGAVSHREEMVLSIVQTVKSITGIRRPALPSRKSSGMLQSIGVADHPSLVAPAQGAPDPEGVVSQDTSPEETELQNRLLQSFITHVFEEYLLNLPDADDVPGMAWSSRLSEKLNPGSVIPHKASVTERFTTEQRLARRVDAVGQLVSLAHDLFLRDVDLLAAAIVVESVPSSLGIEDDPPASAADIPLSRVGSLLLYTARQSSMYLHESRPAETPPPFAIFPDHHELLRHCLSSPASGTGTLGTEPYALIDGAIALGLICLEQDNIGEPQSDEEFNTYLQLISLLSSNCPSPNLRGHAHYLTSTVLRSHPDESVRLSFIRDTLEHCPFENLKVSAVGWIKGETIEANPPTPMPGHEADASPSSKSMFATPLALDSLAPFLFPSVSADILTPPIEEGYATFGANLSFYLSSLNLLYLLLCAKHLHSALEIQDMWKDNDVAGSFLQPLRDASKRFRTAMEPGNELAEDKTESGVAELDLLDNVIERVTRSVGFLNES
jgi:hypothetical protein